jgi:uncharacterized membrane protein
MSLHLLIRFLHILAAIVFAGGLLARQVVRGLMAGATDVGQILTLSLAAGRIERLMVIPANLLVIALGLVLAFDVRAPILGSLQGDPRNWLLISIIILILLSPLVPLVFLPRGKIFDSALEEASRRGEITASLREQLADPVVRWAHAAELLGVGLVVFLMVFRPF